MFTGIIQAMGRIQAVERRGTDLRLSIVVGKLPMADVVLGDSIAVNGVCLTVVENTAVSFVADVSSETLSRATLGDLDVGASVNLEKALTLATRLGGHLVSGHVDGIGEVRKRWSDGRSERFVIEAPLGIAKYIAEKGSICVDGISLTVNAVQATEFELNIVPHTLAETTMGAYKVGCKVNLEVDLIARYIERLLSAPQAETGQPAITETLLAQYGFIK